MSKRLTNTATYLASVCAALFWLPGATEPQQSPDTTSAVTAGQLECSPAGSSVARLYAESGLSESVEVCTSRGNTSLVVVSADEGSWIDVLRPVSTEWAVMYALRPGNYPTVASDVSGGSTRIAVEWIGDDKGRTVALVFPVEAQSPEADGGPSDVVRYFVVRLPRQNACVLGAVRSLEEARALGRSPQECVADSTE